MQPGCFNLLLGCGFIFTQPNGHGSELKGDAISWLCVDKRRTQRERQDRASNQLFDSHAKKYSQSRRDCLRLHRSICAAVWLFVRFDLFKFLSHLKQCASVSPRCGLLPLDVDFDCEVNHLPGK